MAEDGHEGQLNLTSKVCYNIIFFFAWWFGANRLDYDGDGDFDPTDVQKYLEDRGILRKNFTRHGKKVKKKREIAVPGVAAIEGDTAVSEVVVDRLSQHWPWFTLIYAVAVFGLWVFTAVQEGSNDVFQESGGLDYLFDRQGQTDLRTHELCPSGCTQRPLGLPASSCANYQAEVYRLLTYQFTHGSIQHVLNNVLMLIILGIPLEGLVGTVWLFVMFQIGVLGGGLCYTFSDGHRPVVGCSGGIYALLGIHVAQLILNWKQNKFRYQAVVVLIVLATAELVVYYTTMTDSKTSHSAHLGGAVAGLLIGVLLGENIQVKKWERAVQILSFFVGLGLVAFCILWTFVNGNTRNVFEKQNWCWLAQVYSEDDSGYRCVRCGEQSCIDRWLAMPNIYETTWGTCRTIGFLNDGIEYHSQTAWI